MLKQFVLAGGLLAAGLAQAFAPQAGAWVVTAENNGTPGRGMALDVQGSTLVMQMYAYDSAGNPTFYLSAGQMDEDHKFTGKLNQYKGGRYFGSGALVGQETADAGQVSLRFVSGVKGYVKFPGEDEKEISRFQFNYNEKADSLKGQWLFTSVGDLGITTEFYKLEKEVPGAGTGTGMMATEDGRFGCENIIYGDNAGTVQCTKRDANSLIMRTYRFVYSVNEGEGTAGTLSKPNTDTLYVRRLTTVDGHGTGIVPASASAPKAAAVINAQSQKAAQQ